MGGPYALPHAYDLEIPDDLCLMCAVNICGLCEEGRGEPCLCSHGVEWPAENPWHALWSFGPGTLGYTGAMALAAATDGVEALVVVP